MTGLFVEKKKEATMTDPTLTIPLAECPPLPWGCPVVVTTDLHGSEHGLCLGVEADSRVMVLLQCGAIERHDVVRVTLDLSPPDPPGGRVDGLDVALRTLGANHYNVDLIFPLTSPETAELRVGDRSFVVARPGEKNDDTALRRAVREVILAGGGGRRDEQRDPTNRRLRRKRPVWVRHHCEDLA